MWEPTLGVHTNLEQILNIVLPRKEETTETETYEVDCSICYSHRLNGHIPSKTCDNVKCAQQFHIACLYEVNISTNLKINQIIQTRNQMEQKTHEAFKSEPGSSNADPNKNSNPKSIQSS